MEIKWIKTFIVAAQYENLRKTSEELFLTQPAVTKHIQRLEERLQIQLFEREGKKIRLSAAGGKYLPHAKALLTQYETGLAAFESWKHGYEQKVQIAVAPQIASSILPEILSEFMSAFPKIDVHINVINSYEVAKEVGNGNADIGLTRVHSLVDNIESEIVLEEPVVLVAPYTKDEETEEDILAKYRLITYNHPVYWDDLIHQIHQHYAFTKTFKVNQIEVTKRFIEQGLGASYLPYSMIQKELQYQMVKIISAKKIVSPISQTYVLTKVKTDEVTAFVRFLKEKLKER